MRRQPRRPDAPLLPVDRALPSLLSGLALTLAVLGMYWLHLRVGPVYARSAAVAVLIMGSLLLVWAERAGERPWWSLPWPRSLRFWLVWGIVAGSLPLFMVIPVTAHILGIGPLAPRDWALAAALALASIGWRAFGTGWLRMGKQL